MTDRITLDNFKSDPDLLSDWIDFYFNFRPYDYQKRFLLKCINNNRIAAKWSRQSGKSQSVAIYSLFRCLLQPTVILILAPTLTQSGELYNKIRMLASSNPNISRFVTKSTQTELQLSNGSRIKAVPTGEDGSSARGFTADVLILEESQKISDSIVNSVAIPIIASKGDEGQIIKIGTPWVKNHFYYSCYKDTNYVTEFVTYQECLKVGQYTETFIAEQKENLTDVEFRTEYMAEFIDENASFFSVELIDSCMENYRLNSVL